MKINKSLSFEFNDNEVRDMIVDYLKSRGMLREAMYASMNTFDLDIAGDYSLFVSFDGVLTDENTLPWFVPTIDINGNQFTGSVGEPTDVSADNRHRH